MHRLKQSVFRSLAHHTRAISSVIRSLTAVGAVIRNIMPGPASLYFFFVSHIRAVHALIIDKNDNLALFLCGLPDDDFRPGKLSRRSLIAGSGVVSLAIELVFPVRLNRRK
ncbi:hypothetical protein [Cedecea colo]|uniref:Uncharacterized protein n=1 Tax=Cedecea colo TaxID=2552946 RepID=A0ABX0VH29_9ENTR|nr:hypothetical protein [Cedecea colo]NIY46404.1 hypothetical protein [Cedecea colo]